MRPDGRQFQLSVSLWCSTIPSVAESYIHYVIILSCGIFSVKKQIDPFVIFYYFHTKAPGCTVLFVKLITMQPGGRFQISLFFLASQ